MQRKWILLLATVCYIVVLHSIRCCVTLNEGQQSSIKNERFQPPPKETALKAVSLSISTGFDSSFETNQSSYSSNFDSSFGSNESSYSSDFDSSFGTNESSYSSDFDSSFGTNESSYSSDFDSSFGTNESSYSSDFASLFGTNESYSSDDGRNGSYPYGTNYSYSYYSDYELGAINETYFDENWIPAWHLTNGSHETNLPHQPYVKLSPTISDLIKLCQPKVNVSSSEREQNRIDQTSLLLKSKLINRAEYKTDTHDMIKETFLKYIENYKYDYLNASQETCDTMRPPNFNNLTAFYRKPTECNYSCHVMWMGRNKMYVDFTLVGRTQPNVNGSTCLLKGAMAQIRDSTRPLGKFLTMIDLYIHDCVPGRQNMAIRMYEFPKPSAHMEWLPPGTLARNRSLSLTATYIKNDYSYWTEEVSIPRRPLQRKKKTKLKLGPNFPKPNEFYA